MRHPAKHYTVMLEGRGYTAVTGGKSRRVGFYTTRWVYADSEREAGKEAIRQLQSEDKFQTLVLKSATDGWVQATQATESNPDMRREVLPGYAFYLDEEPTN